MSMDLSGLVAQARERLRRTHPKVALCLVRREGAPRATSFDDSLEALRDFDARNLRLLRRKLTQDYRHDLPAARNRVASEFLASECDWALMVDLDMGFEPDALYRLLAAADPDERPIVGGLCFRATQTEPDGMGGFRTSPTPTIYEWREDPKLRIPGPIPVPTYPVNAVIRCFGTGAAFLLVHRSALERIAETTPPNGDRPFGHHWFDRLHDVAGHLLGEDLSFFVRADIAKVPVHVHTGVRTSHAKEVWLSESDHWERLVVPPATDEVAVIVPVLRRPQNAAPFMRSLRASTGLARVYAIADEDDPETIRAWHDAGAEVIVDNVLTFARKVNLGYRKTAEPWLFIVGDDVTFRPAWLDHAQHVARTFSADVVGTNDLGNPRVIRGEHATHLLIRRSYVDGEGASFDGPGIVCHEGYRHWGPDTEIVELAKSRGAWQMALGSLVVHNHPLWGRGQDDATYQLGLSAAEQDLALLRRRLAEHLGVKS